MTWTWWWRKQTAVLTAHTKCSSKGKPKYLFVYGMSNNTLLWEHFFILLHSGTMQYVARHALQYIF
jgi:hypothetical protein